MFRCPLIIDCHILCLFLLRLGVTTVGHRRVSSPALTIAGAIADLAAAGDPAAQAAMLDGGGGAGSGGGGGGAGTVLHPSHQQQQQQPSRQRSASPRHHSPAVTNLASTAPASALSSFARNTSVPPLNAPTPTRTSIVADAVMASLVAAKAFVPFVTERRDSKGEIIISALSSGGVGVAQRGAFTSGSHDYRTDEGDDEEMLLGSRSPTGIGAGAAGQGVKRSSPARIRSGLIFCRSFFRFFLFQRRVN